jgi:carbon-monoxide dehydrogenase large subunit
MKRELITAGALDRPNSYIGRAVPRPNAKRLLQGKGQFVDDLTLPRMLHVAFVRSPHAHARIGAIETAAAASSWRRTARRGSGC